MKNWSIELGRYDKIQAVFISYRDSKIQGIAFDIMDALGNKTTHKFGMEHYNYAIMLKPNEYIQQLSGTYRSNANEPQTTIESLTIHTNLSLNGLLTKNENDTLDSEKDVKMASFPVQTSDGIILEVFGTAYREPIKQTGYETFLLSSIGFDVMELRYNDEKYEMPKDKENEEKWSMKLDRCEYIKEIITGYGDFVDGIGFVKIDALGRRTPLQWFGNYGGETYRIILKRNEYIVRISGTFDNNKIATLRIHTNFWLCGYKLCGAPSSSGESFSIPAQTSDYISQIYGTCGKTGKYLSSIGISAKKPISQRRRNSIPNHGIKTSDPATNPNGPEAST
ncbi:Mannose/glucose-specific lectin [Bienertia sinuspersici]